MRRLSRDDLITSSAVHEAVGQRMNYLQTADDLGAALDTVHRKARNLNYDYRRHGLVPHGLRHSLKTWMTDDGIREILQARRLGHQVPGMQGIYTHVSAAMREELRMALQVRWENSLRARAPLASYSPVSLLDDLLELLRRRAAFDRPPRWEPGLERGKGISQTRSSERPVLASMESTL